jgi:hypothetical protein
MMFVPWLAQLVTFLVTHLTTGRTWNGKFIPESDNSEEEQICSQGSSSCPYSPALWQFLLEYITFDVSFSPTPVLAMHFDYMGIHLSFAAVDSSTFCYSNNIERHNQIDLQDALDALVTQVEPKLAESFKTIITEVFQCIPSPSEKVYMVSLSMKKQNPIRDVEQAISVKETDYVDDVFSNTWDLYE